MAAVDNLNLAFQKWFACSPSTPTLYRGSPTGDIVFVVSDSIGNVVFNMTTHQTGTNIAVTVTNPTKGRVFQETLTTIGLDAGLLRDRILQAAEFLLLVARDKDQYDWLSAAEWIQAYGINNPNDPTGTLP